MWWHLQCEWLMTHNNNPRDVCQGRTKNPMVLSVQVRCCIFWIWNAFGGIPWSSVNPDTKCEVRKKKKKNVYTMSSRFLTLVSLAPYLGMIKITGLKSCPPKKKKVTVLGLMFHPKASGWMFFSGFKKLETDSRNWRTNAHKHTQQTPTKHPAKKFFKLLVFSLLTTENMSLRTYNYTKGFWSYVFARTTSIKEVNIIYMRK